MDSGVMQQSRRRRRAYSHEELDGGATYTYRIRTVTANELHGTRLAPTGLWSAEVVATERCRSVRRPDSAGDAES